MIALSAAGLTLTKVGLLLGPIAGDLPDGSRAGSSAS